MINHRPSGSMCMVCVSKDKCCSWIDFTNMKVLKVDKCGTKVVKCEEFEKDNSKGLTTSEK